MEGGTSGSFLFFFSSALFLLLPCPTGLGPKFLLVNVHLSFIRRWNSLKERAEKEKQVIFAFDLPLQKKK
jgi:hypothetical protein